MTERERDIERALVGAVKKAGGLCLKWVCPGWSGVPDRIVLLPGGRVIFVEVKRPKGGRLSELQKKWAKILMDLGFDYFTIWNKEELKLFQLIELKEVKRC